MLTDEQRFLTRYYLGFPDLPSLPPSDTTDPELILLLQRSTELETRMSNLSASAETMVVELLGKLGTAILELDSISGRFPFKRIEDITFRDDELSIRWEANGTLINSLANILGIRALREMGPIGIRLEVV